MNIFLISLINLIAELNNYYSVRYRRVTVGLKRFRLLNTVYINKFSLVIGP